MSVEPGFAGQKFIPDVLPKLEKIKDLITKKVENRSGNRWRYKF